MVLSDVRPRPETVPSTDTEVKVRTRCVCSTSSQPEKDLYTVTTYRTPQEINRNRLKQMTEGNGKVVPSIQPNRMHDDQEPSESTNGGGGGPKNFTPDVKH